jgi:hypothetical protein
MLDLDMDMDLEALEGFPSSVPVPLYYGQYIAPTHIARDQKAKSREEKIKSHDKLLVNTLKLLVAFFPSTDSPSGPLEEGRLYRLSFLFDRVAELLRNDSIIDITLRKELYTQVFMFVQVSPGTGIKFCLGISVDYHRLSQLSQSSSDFCWRNAPTRAMAPAFKVFGTHHSEQDSFSKARKIFQVSKLYTKHLRINLEAPPPARTATEEKSPINS